MAAATIVPMQSPLQASTTTLTFEGLSDGQSIGNYYNGGAGGSYGIAFSVDATAFIQTLIPVPVDGGYPNPDDGAYNNGGSGLFGGEPSAVTAMMFCDDNNFVAAPCPSQTSPQTIDVAGGFSTYFSLYYSAPLSGGQLDIYSGLDGSGNVLGTLFLATTPLSDSSGDGGCDEYGAASDPSAPACPFVPASIALSGTAESVVFTGATDVMFFDDISFGSSTPEPSTWFPIATGLAGIGIYRRMRIVRG